MDHPGVSYEAVSGRRTREITGLAPTALLGGGCLPAALDAVYQAATAALRRSRADFAKSSSTATDMSQSMQPSVIDWP